MEFNEFIEYVFSWSNPVIYVVLFSILILTSVVVIIKFVIIPYQRKQFEEKYKLEQKNKELMSLLAELDPDPILRVNDEGRIIQYNKAAKATFSIEAEKTFESVFDKIEMDWHNQIESNKTTRSLETIENRFYVVDVKGVKDLNTVQIYFHDITDRINYEKEVEEYKNRLRILSEYLDTQQEEIRDRVSSILHDDVGQRLFSLRLLIENNEKYFGESNNYKVILEQFDSTYESIRELSHELKPVRLKEQSIVKALSQLIINFNNSCSIEGKFSYSNNNLEIGNRLKTCVFRVVQEAIINIIKHSEASEYYIHIKDNDDKINLIVSDNGKGMKEAEEDREYYFKSGIGLFNMKERVEYLNGDVKIETSPNNGFTIYVNLPMI